MNWSTRNMLDALIVYGIIFVCLFGIVNFVTHHHFLEAIFLVMRWVIAGIISHNLQINVLYLMLQHWNVWMWIYLKLERFRPLKINLTIYSKSMRNNLLKKSGLSWPYLQQTASQFNEAMEIQYLKASPGWIQKFWTETVGDL